MSIEGASKIEEDLSLLCCLLILKPQAVMIWNI
jgi:hypothetical protein